MLHKVSDQMADCYQRALECERKSKDLSYDAITRADYALIARSWLQLAHSYEIAARVSRFLEWNAPRLSRVLWSANSGPI